MNISNGNRDGSVKRVLWRWLIVVGLLGSSLGCMYVTERLIPSLLGDPRPSVEAPSEFPASPQEVLRFTVENRSPYAICDVHISPSDAEAWGEDWLSPTEVIQTGTSRIFEVPILTGEPSAYDVLVLDCERAALASAWELSVDKTLIVGGTGKVPLRLLNASGVEICYVFFVEDAQQMERDDDYLGQYESIAEGETRVFFVDPGTYNMLAVGCDGEEVAWQAEVPLLADEILWRVERLQEPGRDGASGEAFAVRVENETPDAICYVHISPARSERWGENWLEAEDEIAPGAWRSFEVSGGAYDVLVVNCAGAVIETAWGISETITLRPGSTGSVAFTLVNESAEDICYVYISPASAETWGENWMGTLETIPSPDAARVFYVPPGTYDVEAQDCDGNALFTEYDVEVIEDLTRIVRD